MEKLYAILKVDFTFNGTKLTNIKKLVLSNVITGGDFKVQTGQMDNRKTGSIVVKPANPAELLYVAIFPTNGFKPKFEVYTTDNKAYTYTVTASDWETKTAKVYPITVAVKEFTPNPPYVEVEGVKWGKYNLQYTPDKKEVGWVDGYHLAKNHRITSMLVVVRSHHYLLLLDKKVQLLPKQINRNLTTSVGEISLSS